mmetsp:Transcript_5265/g.7802  ORF Transcript_5265/g.7802 Transcript_5265/m.7802 type:complete len:105 (+) Transcript_5265:95-409(+)
MRNNKINKNNVNNNDDLSVHIRKLQYELSNQHRQTNAMINSIQQKANAELHAKLPLRIKAAEEESSYKVKHSQLVSKAQAKKKKEEAMKLKQKQSASSETWVPW